MNFHNGRGPYRRSRSAWLAAFLLPLVFLSACSKHTEPTSTASPGTAPGANGGQWVGTTLRGNDPAALRAYIESVTEIAPRKFKVEWNPATVALDRAAALRSLRSVSRDGAVIGLASSEPAVARLRPGSILWVWDIAVRKVQSLETQGDVTLVRTVPVPLTEAMPNAEIEFEAPLTLKNYYISRRATPPPPATSRISVRSAPGFRYAVYDPNAPGDQPGSEPGAPPDADTPPPGDNPSDDDWYDEGMSANGFTGAKNGWNYSIGYNTRPGGITLELQARKGDDVGGGSDSGVDPNAVANKFKEIEKERKQIREEINKVEDELRNEQQDLKKIDNDFQGRMQQLQQEQLSRKNPTYEGPRLPPRQTDSGGFPLNDQGERQKLQKQWDDSRASEAKKLAAVEQALGEARIKRDEIEARKRTLKAAKEVAKQLWDIVSDNVDARIRARMELDGFTMGESLVFKNGQVDLASTHFKNLNGNVRAQLIGRLGHTGAEQIKIPVMQVPIAFNVPIPVGGIPFVVQVGADFSLTMSLTGANATLKVDGQTAFRGDGGFDYSNSKASYSTEFKGNEPQISDYKGFSLGVSAVVLGVQIPRLGMGLGVFGVSSVAYVDVVNVITMTNGGAIGGLGPPCKRITYTAVGHVGIETEIIPLPFGAAEKLEKSLSPKKEIFKLERELLDPPVKMCEIK
jgi:hypothetical protein